MPSKVLEDFSDSESDCGSSGGDIESSVQLGIPDGSISSQSDLLDPCVSRIGGRPAFVMSYEPEASCSQCKNCSGLMQMVVQIWCPLEDSPMDRALYVWACSNGSCQKKDGSVRAWRGIKLNEKYAAKLAKKAMKKKEREEKARSAASSAAVPPTKTNPFSLPAVSESTSFGLGFQIFGGASAIDAQSPQQMNGDGHSGDDDLSSEEDEDSDELAAALGSTTLDDSSIWKETPAYASQYLSTISEYLPPPPKVKSVHVDDPIADGDKKNKESISVLEAYENSLNVDEVFSKFTKRVAHEGQQCIRYDFKGIPLLYASDSVFDRLFPTPKMPVVTVTRNVFMPVNDKRTFSKATIPQCQNCRSTRVFECQLMPHLINIMRSTPAPNTALSDMERRREVERELKNKRGMEWGTCMIFCCESNCGNGKDGWMEEFVVVQWE